MSKRRIVVVGSRLYPDINEVRQFVFEQERDAIIISGGASGVDSVAIDAARYYRMAYEVYPARWSVLGRSAGAARNREMVHGADEVVAFWDGRSRGTKMTIEFARAAGKPCRVFQPAHAQHLSVAAVGSGRGELHGPTTRDPQSSSSSNPGPQDDQP